MSKHAIRIAAGEFKAKCLHLMDEVNETKVAITITKRGVPIAQLVPMTEKPFKLFGLQQGTMKITDDIISPIDEDWDANQ
ncbi:MAG: type II toxin-antitoxin system prevent-host-death family antitoxin [Gammaproteobacteria bacterium]|nr:type II toxin-antitoxin system prevent-host-death family antitoxin [Gammaproteobacteria bacterium]